MALISSRRPARLRMLFCCFFFLAGALTGCLLSRAVPASLFGTVLERVLELSDCGVTRRFLPQFFFALALFFCGAFLWGHVFAPALLFFKGVCFCFLGCVLCGCSVRSGALRFAAFLSPCVLLLLPSLLLLACFSCRSASLLRFENDRTGLGACVILLLICAAACWLCAAVFPAAVKLIL